MQTLHHHFIVFNSLHMYCSVDFTVVAGVVVLSQPESYMLIIQERQAEGQRQQVEEVVVARQNNKHLQKNLHREKK